MKILIVSNDPGGAEIISSWVRRNTKNRYEYILGPSAETVFRSKINLLKMRNFGYLKEKDGILNYDTVITGTSEESNLEKQAIRISKKHKIRVVTMLDYWTNFYKRFVIDGILTYPDEIWVIDKYAMNNAKKELPGGNIVLKNNPYILDL